MPIMQTVIQGGGTTPTGTIGWIPRDVDANGKLVMPTMNASSLKFNTIKVIDSRIINYAFYECTGLTGVLDLSSLTTVSGAWSMYYAFYGCTGLTGIDLSSLTTVSGSRCMYYAFYGCTGLTGVDLSSLTTVSGEKDMDSVFYNCTGLTGIDLSSLTTISGSYCMQSIFRNCTALTTVRIGNITAIDFGSYYDQFTNMFQGCTQNIDVYAPAASQSRIESMTGYPKFGGTGTVTWHWNS